ncbi:MAG: BrxE family protein [Desulfobulbus sp.]|jgi:hypothetical protein|uniref:BrxE family protein n=1 Tax=Desulfobulbus sp. TaxID=895 RepID=UPI002849DF7D|nr:BrxE family protein [Desulfobulbus sp.]
MTATSTTPGQFGTLRLVVAYFGQANQAGRWDCDFLDATGLRFLETIFPRTARSFSSGLQTVGCETLSLRRLLLGSLPRAARRLTPAEHLRITWKEMETE